MSYLDRFDRHVRDCCGVLSVEEQVRSGFKTKGEVAKTAKILFREFGKKTKSKKSRNKKTGETECCCCSVEAIAKKLVPPSIKEIRDEQKSIHGKAFKNRSRGGNLFPIPAGYSENGSILVSASPSLFTLTDPYSGLGQGPNYTLSSYSSFPDDLEIVSVSDDMSEPDSFIEERAEIARMNDLGEDELTQLYNLGMIDLNQYAEGIEQLREGIPIREILQLGSREVDIGEGAEERRRGGARQGAGRPTREQVEIAREEEMRPSEVRAVDQTLDRMIDDIEEEEDFLALADY